MNQPTDTKPTPEGTAEPSEGRVATMQHHTAEGGSAVVTTTYPDGTTATGTAPLPEQSPAQQQAAASEQPEQPKAPEGPQERDAVRFIGTGSNAGVREAIITRVWGESCVNLVVDENGLELSFTSVFLWKPGRALPGGYFCYYHSDEAQLPKSLLAPPQPERLPFTLEDARALPELADVSGDLLLEPLATDNPPAITAFKDTDGRTMRVVHTPGNRRLLSKVEHRRERAEA